MAGALAEIGKAWETQFSNECRARGMRVRDVSAESLRYDFVVNEHRVQCKVLTWWRGAKRGGVSARIHHPRAKAYTIDEIDVLALRIEGESFIVPADEHLRAGTRTIKRNFGQGVLQKWKNAWRVLEGQKTGTLFNNTPTRTDVECRERDAAAKRAREMGCQILSLFPGIGLLDQSFESEGFQVFRGPDLLWGGDIRTCSPAPGVFWGVMGGSPCQEFSSLRRTAPTGEGLELLEEFRRVVLEASPEWWMLENVARVPDLEIPGYRRQRLDLNQAWYSGVSRLRHIQFGSRSGELLDIPRGRPTPGAEPAALACDDRSFREVCRLQGLPDDFDLPGFLLSEKIRAVGNGVPIVLGRVLAQAIRTAYGLETGPAPEFDPAACQRRRCACGCGRVVGGQKRYDGPTCRKRAERKRRRDRYSNRGVTGPWNGA